MKPINELQKKKMFLNDNGSAGEMYVLTPKFTYMYVFILR